MRRAEKVKPWTEMHDSLFVFIRINRSKSQTRNLVLQKAMNQAVQESTDMYEGMMIQEIHAVPKIDMKGTRRESERSVAQVVGSEAWRTEHSCAAWDQVVLQAAQKEKEKVRGKPDEVISASHHPKLVSDWLAGIDVATRMEDLELSGVVFDGHQMELGTLDLKMATGILKIILAKFKRKLDVLEETQHKNKRPTLTSRHIMYQIFSFFDINMTQGRTMRLTYLLNIQLHNDNLKTLSNRLGKKHYNPRDRRSLYHQKNLKTCSRDSSKSLHR